MNDTHAGYFLRILGRLAVIYGALNIERCYIKRGMRSVSISESEYVVDANGAIYNALSNSLYKV